MRIDAYRKKIFCAVFAAVVLLLFAENNDAAGNADPLNKSPDEKSISFDSKTSEEQTLQESAPLQDSNNSGDGLNQLLNDNTASPVGKLFSLLGALIIVCILAYVVIKILKKSSHVFGTDDPYLKTVASINIAQGKSVHIITLGEKAYIIGVTDSAINKIGEVEDKALIDAMNLESDRKSASVKKDFSSVLASFLPQLRQKENAASKDFFAAQRERLNRAAENKKEAEE